MKVWALAGKAVKAAGNFHENRLSIEFAQRVSGKLCLFVISGILLYIFKAPFAAIAAIPLISFLPGRRKLILTLGSAGFIVEMLLRGPCQSSSNSAIAKTPWTQAGVALLAVFGFVYAVWLTAKNFERLPAAVRRYKQVFLHGAMWVLLAVVWYWKSEYAILAAVMLPFVVWRCGYLLISAHRGKVAGTGFLDHLYYLLPVWNGTNVPFGKGAEYLCGHRTQSGEDFAKSQLAGLKLLLLALAWKGTNYLMQGPVYGVESHRSFAWFGRFTLGIPHLDSLISGDVSVGILTAWLSIYLDIIRITLVIAGLGHVFIGTLRLFGFNVFRNTYKPLLAETIVDFWGRFYYYFKELLVDMFFYPTFVKYFKGMPKLRLFAAVFAAAFLGNMYYHLLWMQCTLVRGDFEPTLSYLRSYWLYCLLLSIGIYLSMQRAYSQGNSAAGQMRPATKLVRLRRIAVVWTFFSLINIWNVVGGELTLAGRTSFFFSLFGIG